MDPDLRILLQLLNHESKFSLEAFLFVREGLAYAADQLALERCSQTVPATAACEKVRPARKHVSGQQLCEGIRQYALNQFGYMSKTVLNSWGIHSTSDIGDVVYKMINAGIMKKSSKDRRSHFDDVFDFDAAFESQYDFATECSPARRV